MKAVAASMLAAAALVAGGSTIHEKSGPAASSADRGVRWLVSVQGHNGGWGQDGGETSYVRTGERLETQGNDVANTAVAVQALVRSGHTPVRGQYRDAVRRGVEFILKSGIGCGRGSGHCFLLSERRGAGDEQTDQEAIHFLTAYFSGEKQQPRVRGA